MNNTLQLLGFAGGDPEITTIKDGTNVAKFSFGVKEYKAGKETTMWINVEAWSFMAERVMKLVKSGRELSLTGRLCINHYDKQIGDQTVKMTRVVLNLHGIHVFGSRTQSTSKGSSKQQETA